jgi:hypothetical protein
MPAFYGTTTVSGGLSYVTAAATPVVITIAPGTLAAALTAIGATGFAARVQAAVACIAVGVLMEDGALDNGAARWNYARLILNNPSSFVAQIVYPVTIDGVTDSSSTDQALINRLLALWDQLSYGGAG